MMMRTASQPVLPKQYESLKVQDFQNSKFLQKVNSKRGSLVDPSKDLTWAESYKISNAEPAASKIQRNKIRSKLTSF